MKTTMKKDNVHYENYEDNFNQHYSFKCNEVKTITTVKRPHWLRYSQWRQEHNEHNDHDDDAKDYYSAGNDNNVKTTTILAITSTWTRHLLQPRHKRRSQRSKGPLQ